MRTSRFLSFFILLLPLQTFAEVYDVSTTAELRAALASAAEAGGDNTIRLAAGTYSTQDDDGGTLKYLSTQNSNLELVGADQLTTVIDGNSVDKVLLFVIQDEVTLGTLRMSSLTITNGLDDGTSDPYYGGGGGVDVDADIESVILEDMRFSQNEARFKGGVPYSGRGGALWLRGRTQLRVENSTFLDNTARYGGAIYTCQWDILDSTFSANIATSQGGAVSHCGSTFNATRHARNSEFTENSAAQGGVFYFDCGGDHFYKRNLFKANTASSAGGVMSSPCDWIEGNVFSENSAPDYGVTGGLGSALILNNVFLNNPTQSRPALGVWRNVTANNLFLGTSVEIFKELILSNNIFLLNEVDITSISGDDFHTISNNYVDTSKLPDSIINIGGSNIFEGVNLGFVNAEEGNYRLTSSSGLIDAGTTDPDLAYITDYDYTGTTARVIGASIDIGPYEYDGEAPPDSDGDGLNDNIDNCPSIANEDQADFDSDGEGDVCDSDDDNDGTNDEDDAFPFDDTESLDTDGDGVGNNEDEDDDGDGFLDDSDPQPIIANVFAIDSDGDGVGDSIDDYPTDATKQFGSDGDFDGDGFTNDEEVDYCSNPFDKNSQPELGGLSLPLIQVITEQ